MKFRGRMILVQLEAFMYYQEMENKKILTNQDIENFVAFIYPELPNNDENLKGNLEKERIRHSASITSMDSPTIDSEKNILEKVSSSNWTLKNNDVFRDNGITIDSVMSKVNKAIKNGNEINFKPKKRNKKEDKKEKRILVKKESITYARDLKVIKEAKRIANYKCEFDNNHNYVIQDDGKVYTHGHHLIPMQYQDNFNNSLDIVENICVLCNVDHDILHHGNKTSKIELLGALYYKKIEGLKNVGLEISFEELLTIYNLI